MSQEAKPRSYGGGKSKKVAAKKAPKKAVKKAAVAKAPVVKAAKVKAAKVEMAPVRKPRVVRMAKIARKYRSPAKR